MLRYAQLRREGETLESVSERREMLAQHACHLKNEIELWRENMLVLDDKVSIYKAIEVRLKTDDDVSKNKKDRP